jgi:hypothetical protein
LLLRTEDEPDADVSIVSTNNGITRRDKTNNNIEDLISFLVIKLLL